MDEFLTSVGNLVRSSIDAAGDLAEGAASAATGAASEVLAMYQREYDKNIAAGMTPQDAADKAERDTRQYLRDVWGVRVL